MRVVSLLLVLITLVWSAQAAAYRWRLSEKEVLTIAERAMMAKRFKLSDYPDRTVKRHEKDHTWSVLFSPPMPAPVDSDVLVIVNDRTREAEVLHGA